jgi:ribosomal protein S8
MKFMQLTAVPVITAILLSLSACAAPGSAQSSGVSNSQVKTAVSSVVVQPDSSAPLSSEAPTSAPAVVSAIRKQVSMDRFGVYCYNIEAKNPGTVYEINGDLYIDAEDASLFSETALSYEKESHTLRFGDESRADAAHYMSDLSAYPRLGDSSSFPEINWISNGVTDYKYSSLVHDVQKILSSNGFVPATEKQYAQLTGSFSQFKEGKKGNTYVKLGKSGEEYALQFIKGKGKCPITVRMKGETEALRNHYVQTSAASGASRPDQEKDKRASAVPVAVTLQYFQRKINTMAYSIGAGTFLNLKDVSRLFHTRILYSLAEHSISYGDNERVNSAYVMPVDLDQYPNMEAIVGSAPYEIWSGLGNVDFKFRVPRKAISKIKEAIIKKLKSEGFSVPTEKQFYAITKDSFRVSFRQGKRENTYFKNNRIEYGDGTLSSHTYESILQINISEQNSDSILEVEMMEGPYEH